MSTARRVHHIPRHRRRGAPGAAEDQPGPRALGLDHRQRLLGRVLEARRRILVAPGELAGRRAAFSVAGCHGYVLGSVAGDRVAA